MISKPLIKTYKIYKIYNKILKHNVNNIKTKIKPTNIKINHYNNKYRAQIYKKIKKFNKSNKIFQKIKLC